ncbi:GIN domain-containing protein [Flavobacteriaceae bacterium LMO-SS05]
MRVLVIVLSVLLSISATAQKKLKIRGDKDVTEIYRSLLPFNQIEVSDGLKVTMMQANTEGYKLTADFNLIDVIKLEVIDSVLKVYTTNRIVKSKKLEIDLTFLSLNKIVLNKNSKVFGQNNIKLDSLELIGFDGSDFELDMNASKVTFRMSGSSDGKIKLKSETASMSLDDNAFLKGSLSVDTLDLSINKRADMKIEGNCDQLQLITTGSTDVKAKNLKATNVNINAANTSDIYIYASKYLSVYAKGRSNIYIYGNPEIKVEGLNDKSKIIKK